MAELTKEELKKSLRKEKEENKALKQSLEETNKKIDDLAALFSKFLSHQENPSEEVKEEAKEAETEVDYTEDKNVNTENIGSEIDVIYLSSAPGFVSGQNFQQKLNRNGQVFTLSRSACDELVGKYGSWFESGILAISSKNIAFAKSRRLKTELDYFYNYKKAYDFGKMRPEEIETLWGNCTTENEKLNLAIDFRDGYDKNLPGYRDLGRVNMLNSLTQGGFARELVEITNPGSKYQGQNF